MEGRGIRHRGNEMKKIGIITQYYKSKNLGGNLQAYALCNFLREQGFDAEQICFQRTRKKTFKRSIVRRVLSKGKRLLIHPIRELRASKNAKFLEKVQRRYQIAERQTRAFEAFNNHIPHSNNVYNESTIVDCVNDYDIFITGSDQVWNLDWYEPVYFLDFVPSSKPKISYAASMGMDCLTNEQELLVKNSLKDFKAISVREKSAGDLIKGLVPVQPIDVVDPVLLLGREDWDRICDESVKGQDYVCCYFLGRNKKARELAQKFAKEKGLKLFSIPYWSLLPIDFNKNVENMFDLTPGQFIGLIKNAKYIFTDSFHAVVFSFIYQKQYFVFNRDTKGAMNSRIKNITDLFHTSERFCDGKEKENLQYISTLKDIDYSQTNNNVEALKKESMDFLKRNLV